MTDIDALIQRLREGVDHDPNDVPRAEALMDEAADALAKLRDQLAECREALEAINMAVWEMPEHHCYALPFETFALVRTTLGGDPCGK